MADQTQGAGFRFSLIMRWGPPIIAVLGFVLLAIGEWPVGTAVIAAGLVFWLLVRRRGRAVASGEGTPGEAAREEATPGM